MHNGGLINFAKKYHEISTTINCIPYKDEPFPPSKICDYEEFCGMRLIDETSICKEEDFKVEKILGTGSFGSVCFVCASIATKQTKINNQK